MKGPQLTDSSDHSDEARRYVLWLAEMVASIPEPVLRATLEVLHAGDIPQALEDANPWHPAPPPAAELRCFERLLLRQFQRLSPASDGQPLSLPESVPDTFG